MQSAYIIDAVRTPVGKIGGALSSVRPDDLLALVIRALLSQNPGVDPQAIEDVIAGDANQAGEDTRNVARMAALLAGLPVSVAGSTVNRLCGSGLQAVIDAARAIMTGDGDILIAGGVESMSRAPFVRLRSGNEWNDTAESVDSTIGWRFTNPEFASIHPPLSMGQTAEHVASAYGISRYDQDLFALRSHEKYFTARDARRFDGEIVPVQTSKELVTHDEGPRKTSMELLQKLRPAFTDNGSVTAGNAAGLADGAAVLLLASERAVVQYGLNPIAKVKAMAVAGVDPAIMGVGPVPAINKVMTRAGLALNAIGLVELNESFASQSLACAGALDLDAQKLNVNGGAIALGHPLGCSGARITTTLVHEMKRRGERYGLAAMCVGLGQGIAVVFEGC